MELTLHSPMMGEQPISYTWPIPSWCDAENNVVGHEILETIRWVCEDRIDIKMAMRNRVLSDFDANSYVSMRSLCYDFNQAIATVRQLLVEQTSNRTLSRGLLRHILQQTYAQAVTEPCRLNSYEPFSPEVYGETSYDLICEILDLVKPSPDDVFADLGSGVGQVVLQAAALTPCKLSFGIERGDVPSGYAEAMDKRFRLLMQWYGKKSGEYQLIKGDFLDNNLRAKITSATIVFVNNFAFGPVLHHELKQRFADLQDGARIVSFNSFCPLNFRITDRNLGDIGSILRVSQITPTNGSVSWTSKTFSYYLHIVDRTQLEKYFHSEKNKQLARKTQTKTSAKRPRVTRLKRRNSLSSESGSDSTCRPRISVRFDLASEKTQDDTFKENCNTTTRSMKLREIRSTSSTDTADEGPDGPFGPTTLPWSAFVSARTQNDPKEKRSTAKGVSKPTNIFKASKRRGRRVRSIRSKKAVKTTDFLQSGLTAPKLPTPLTPAQHNGPVIKSLPQNSSDALVSFGNTMTNQYLSFLNQMKSLSFKATVEQQIKEEEARKQRLQHFVSTQQSKIDLLVENGMALLKARLKELGVTTFSAVGLLAEVEEAITCQLKLSSALKSYSAQVISLEEMQDSLIDASLTRDAVAVDECFLGKLSSIRVRQEELHKQVALSEKELSDSETAQALLAHVLKIFDRRTE